VRGFRFPATGPGPRSQVTQCHKGSSAIECVWSWLEMVSPER
jgi:hypothetical protein